MPNRLERDPLLNRTFTVLVSQRCSSQVSRDTAHVGKFISTKKVGSNGRDDLTLEYKHSEGSIEERIAFKSIGHGIGGAPAPG